VKVLFKVNGKSVSVAHFDATLFEPSSKRKVYDLKTNDGAFMVPAKMSKSDLFDLEISFLKYRLVFPSIVASQMDSEWVVDVTDPIVQSKSKRKHRKLLKQYSITFHPANAEGTYQMFEIYDSEK